MEWLVNGVSEVPLVLVSDDQLKARLFYAFLIKFSPFSPTKTEEQTAGSDHGQQCVSSV